MKIQSFETVLSTMKMLTVPEWGKYAKHSCADYVVQGKTFTYNKMDCLKDMHFNQPPKETPDSELLAQVSVETDTSSDNAVQGIYIPLTLPLKECIQVRTKLSEGNCKIPQNAPSKSPKIPPPPKTKPPPRKLPPPPHKNATKNLKRKAHELFEKAPKDVIKYKYVMFLLEKLNKLQVLKEVILLLIVIVKKKKKKMRNSLKSKEGKLGCQRCKWSQETLRIKQIGWVDFRYLFYNCQRMVLLTDKSDRCCLVCLDPCV